MSTTVVETIARAYEVSEPPVAYHPMYKARNKPLEDISAPSLGIVTTTPMSRRTSMDVAIDVPNSMNEYAMATADEQRKTRRRYRVVLATFFWCFFLLGLNDGSTGPLLPVYQDFYHLSFLIVSMIFISNCLGCLTSAVSNVWISRRVAFSKILVLAVVFQTIAYSILSGAPPFPLMCIGFYINGMGMSLLNSQCNSLLSMLHNPTAMGLAHASYGVGALVAPLLSTQFADYYTRTRARNWSLYYTILIGASLSNLVSFVTILRGAGYEEVLKGMDASQQEEIDLRNSTS
ncbi:MFS general substrate transporter, partial [Serendipita vermifera]